MTPELKAQWSAVIAEERHIAANIAKPLKRPRLDTGFR
jgi:hypothetical protein